MEITEDRKQPTYPEAKVEVKKWRKNWISKLYGITKNQPLDVLTLWIRRRAKELGVIDGNN